MLVMNGLQKACKAIETEFLDKEEPQEKKAIYSLGSELERELNCKDNLTSKEDLDLVIDITRRVCNRQKNTSQVLEKRLLVGLTSFTYILAGLIEIEDSKESTRGEEEKIEITQNLISFAHELINITKSRDAFSGKRKGYATTLLVSLNTISKVEGLEDIFISNFKSTSSDLLYDNLDSIQEYYNTPEMKDVEVNPKILELVKERTKKAKKRDEVKACLDALIKLNELEEERLGE